MLQLLHNLLLIYQILHMFFYLKDKQRFHPKSDNQCKISLKNKIREKKFFIIKANLNYFYKMYVRREVLRAFLIFHHIGHDRLCIKENKMFNPRIYILLLIFIIFLQYP